MPRVHRTTSFLWRHSTAIRLSAAIALGLLALGSWANAEPSVSAAPVVVASRDLPSGSMLETEDLAEGQAALNITTPDPPALVGETLRGPVQAGEPLTASRLVPGRAVPSDPDQVVFPLTLGDPRIAELLVSGDRVDVILTPGGLEQGESRTVAHGVEVLTVTAADEGPGSTLAQSGAVVLLAVTSQQASALAGIRTGDNVSVAIG